MKLTRITTVLVIGPVAALATAARAQHSDVLIEVSGDNRLVTGNENAGFVPSRVFGAEFGEIPLDPYFAAEPGFEIEDGNPWFTDGDTFGFNITADLRAWTGSGFGPVPDSETLTLEKGSQSRTAGTGTGFVGGFTFAIADALGGIHEDLEFLLNGSDGNNLPGDGEEPDPGVYLLEWELTTSAAGIETSLPFWLVFNNGQDEAVHDAAIEWVEQNLVPEPASVLFLAAGGVALLRRRRLGGE
jgi:hypothetical protein